MAKDFSYNEALEEMEQIMSEIEVQDVDVDKLSEKVKRLSVLIKLCKAKLHDTEEKVHEILEDLLD